MKRFFTKKTISTLLASIALASASVFGFAGCNTQESGSGEPNPDEYVVATKHQAAEKVFALTFPDSIGENKMPVGSYAGPNSAERTYHGQQLPSMVSEEYFEMYKEMGLNYFTATLPYNDPNIEKFLSLCDKYDMGAFPTFASLEGGGNCDSALNVTVNAIESNLDLFATEHKSLLGFYLRDEPTVSMIKKLKNTTDCLSQSKYAGKKYAYGNALPDYTVKSYMWDDDTPVGSWEDYLRLYCESLDLGYLSFDFYPWHINTVSGEEVYNRGYVKALSIARKVANEFEIPVWSCKQVGSLFVDTPKDKQKILPNEEKFRWQMSIDLAYGVKGFTYFLLCGNAFELGNWEEGIDDYFGIFNAYTGQPNVWYDYIKDFSKHLNKIDRILMQSYHDGIITSKGVMEAENIGSELIASGSYHELSSIDSDRGCLTGCYNYNGQTVLYVTNNSYTYENKVKLNFSDDYGYVVIKGDQKTDKAGSTIELDLLPGEGALVMVKYA